jgi:hypothetical protein
LAAGGGRASRAAHQTPHGGHQLVAQLLGGTGGLPIHHAVTGVSVEQPERDLVKRSLHSRDLGEHLYAVPILLDHTLDATHLAFYTAQSR